MSKNFFGFTAFVATASLGLGLMVAGCGDGGDTTPNPLDHVVKTGTVTFNYNVLAKAAAGKTDISNDIKSVKYSFSGVSTDSQLVKTPFRTDATDAYKFVAGDKDQDTPVDVENVDVASTAVVAVYYGENDTIVGWGVDELRWTGDGSATVVAAYSPDTPFPDDMATARPALSMEMHELYPDARWLRDELVMVDGRFCARFEFETAAPDGPIHNDMIVLGHEGRMLIISVSAGGPSRERWMRHSEEILQSLRLPTTKEKP